jgi:glucan 1,3-beta-glucosidase
LIYIPAGTYLIEGTIQLFVNTQIIGDAINFPTLKASSSAANGSVVVSGFDPGQGSTTNFYLGIRNVNIDTTAANVDNCKMPCRRCEDRVTDLL